MVKVGFYVNAGKCRAVEVLPRLSAEAVRLGLDVVQLQSSTFNLQPPTSNLDAVIALGGDGTILRCVHECPGAPVLGFNLGGLGYLSSVEERDFSRALSALAAGCYRVSERTMLEGTHSSRTLTALNEIVFMREMTGHAAVLELAVDGRQATRYLADGLVIATPTGSTAYSLSAGGPVVMPDSAALVITPMNPHALGIRPMVVPEGVRLRVTSRARANGSAEKIGVYADGEQLAMLSGDESVEIRRAAQGARMIELEGYDPYAVLAHKLGWSQTVTR